MSTTGRDASLSATANKTALLAFSADLTKRVYGDCSGNTLISPLSVYLALGMSTNAAANGTRDEMLMTLGLDSDALNTYCGYLYSLYAEDSSTKDAVGIANSIWYNANRLDLTPKQAFLDADSTYFGADIYKADFSDTTVSDINTWVSGKTGGLIPKLVDNLSATDIMVIINTLTFGNKWAEQFDSTQTGTFTKADGTTQSADYLSCTVGSYYDSGKALGFRWNFSNTRFAFIGILPDGTLNDYVSSFDADEFARLLAGDTEADMNTAVPCFTYDFDSVLNEYLSAMGMPSAFGAADFSNGWDVEVGRVVISSVKHKTHVKLDKYGVEAAAATSVTFGETCAWVSTPPESIRLDRPFMFVIMDTVYNVPLFIGTVQGV